jgi:hypothetical protein
MKVRVDPSVPPVLHACAGRRAHRIRRHENQRCCTPRRGSVMAVVGDGQSRPETLRPAGRNPVGPQSQPSLQLRSRHPSVHRVERRTNSIQSHAHRGAGPDAHYHCLADESVHYDSIGVIQGMRHLPTTFTPNERRGPGVAETIAKLQRACDEQGLARPITECKESAQIPA